MRGIKSRVLALLALLAGLCCAGGAAAAQGDTVPRRELQSLLAPVALYPDWLLSQLLMAATYPDEVAAAELWARQNPGQQGEAALRAALRQPWDTSVQAMTAFPLVLARMAEQPDWTRRTGQQFLARETDVLDAIQQLRMKAYASGQLRSGAQLRVQREGQDIAVESASNGLVFVPHYSAGVYGSWPWPDSPPVEWAPWPGYSRAASSSFSWGPGVPISRALVFAGFDWSQRHTHIASVRMQVPLASAGPRPVERAPEMEVARTQPKPEPSVESQANAAVRTEPARPIDLSSLQPHPQLKIDKQPPPASPPEPPAARVPALVHLGKPPPVQAKREAAPAARPKADDEPAVALIQLLPAPLAEAAQNSGASPSPAPAAVHVERAPQAKPAAPPPALARATPVPAPAAPPMALEQPRTPEAVRPAPPIVALSAPAEHPVRERATSVEVEATVEKAVAAPAAIPAKQRRVFISDADRRTLDSILGTSSTQGGPHSERR